MSNASTNFDLFQPQKTFEMKVNISGTELVVLENVKTVDTHAVVLKVLYYCFEYNYIVYYLPLPLIKRYSNGIAPFYA